MMARSFPKKYSNPVMAAVHESVTDLYKVGALGEERMCEFDLLRVKLIHAKVQRENRVWKISAEKTAVVANGDTLHEARENFEKAFESHAKARAALTRRRRK